MTDRSLYETIEQSRGCVSRAAPTPCAPTPATRKPPRCWRSSPAAPILIGEELTYDLDGTPILVGTMSYRADAYRFQADLFRPA